MLIPYTKLINSPIIELKTQTKIGVVSDLVIKKTNLDIAGIILNNSIWRFRDKEVIAASDIMELSKGAVIVNSRDSIVPFSEAVRIKESIDQHFHGIYQRVLTKKGKNIGVVYDYLIESTTLSIAKFYCRTVFTEKIISRNSVIKLEGKKLYIKDDFENVKIAIPAVESSVI